MVEHIRVKHPVTGGEALVPAAALPQLRQSGWEPLTDQETEAREQAERDEVSAAEAAMREQAEAAAADDPARAAEESGAETEEDDNADDAGTRRAANRKGTR